MTIWAALKEEWAIQPAQITSHIWLGALLPLLGYSVGSEWQVWFCGAGVLGIVWEVVGYILSDKKWKASVVGIATYWVGAIMAAAVLLIAGR